jgi:hypothetical protein
LWFTETIKASSGSVCLKLKLYICVSKEDTSGALFLDLLGIINLD